jgi:hypothetical protein
MLLYNSSNCFIFRWPIDEHISSVLISFT